MSKKLSSLFPTGGRKVRSQSYQKLPTDEKSASPQNSSYSHSTASLNAKKAGQGRRRSDFCSSTSQSFSEGDYQDHDCIICAETKNKQRAKVGKIENVQLLKRIILREKIYRL